MPKRPSLSYIAGYFDGEGSIGIYWGKGKKDKKGSWRHIVTISNTYLPILSFLHSRFGGALRVGKKKTKRRRCVYVWALTSWKEIREFLFARKETSGEIDVEMCKNSRK